MHATRRNSKILPAICLHEKTSYQAISLNCKRHEKGDIHDF